MTRKRGKRKRTVIFLLNGQKRPPSGQSVSHPSASAVSKNSGVFERRERDRRERDRREEATEKLFILELKD